MAVLELKLTGLPGESKELRNGQSEEKTNAIILEDGVVHCLWLFSSGLNMENLVVRVK